MGITAQQVKELRDKTGVSIMDCKRALVETGGDVAQAMQVLREKGLATAQKKSARETSEGTIGSYVHSDGKLAVLVELACETDFVARSADFRALAKEICMQVAAMNPQVVSREDLPEKEIENEKDIYRRQAQGKPERVVERIVEGKLEKYFARVCLLEQPYIRDDSRTVADLINEAISRFGENIRVRRFVRMELGGKE